MVCKKENIEENEIIDQDYMFEKRVTVSTVEEKNGENIYTFEITKVLVKIISGPYIFSRRFLQGSRARFYCVGCMRLVPPIYTVTKKSDNEYDDIYKLVDTMPSPADHLFQKQPWLKRKSWPKTFAKISQKWPLEWF